MYVIFSMYLTYYVYNSSNQEFQISTLVNRLLFSETVNPNLIGINNKEFITSHNKKTE